MRNWTRWLTALISKVTAAALLSSCVGPATPFGAMDLIFSESIDKPTLDALSNSTHGVQIGFSPKRMVLHDRTDFRVHIYDPQGIPDDHKIKLFFDDREVSSSFLKNSELSYTPDRKVLSIHFKDLRLPAKTQDAVRLEYARGPEEPVQSALYSFPSCPIKKARSIASIPSFETSEDLISYIDKTARGAGMNPTFIAGIVAQESGFDPKALSWAKALGLMQITPIAEQEILDQVQKWPRHPEINSMSYLTLKTKILTGEINEDTEWRLNSRQALRGGIAYIDYLVSYWEQPQNKLVLEQLKGDPELILSQVLLASYNSGAARVKLMIQENGPRWRRAEKLKEAHSYINKVSSYCYHSSSRKEIQ